MEIEFKLRLPPDAVAALLADRSLAGVKSTRKRLDNIYFDTPAFELAQAKTSLRLRKDGRHWLQTVKSGGSASAGLHQRQELEFPVARQALDWAPLAGTPFATQLAPFQSTVVTQFRTRFDRQLWLLRGVLSESRRTTAYTGPLAVQGNRHQGDLRLPAVWQQHGCQTTRHF